MGPLQIKGRITYARACSTEKDKGWDKAFECAQTVDEIKTLLSDIVKVKESYKPVTRAWVPAGYEMDMFIGPSDGGIEAYGSNIYMRSTCGDDAVCNLVAARAKVSSLDEGDNELLGSLLEAKMAETVIKSIPEKPSGLKLILITDSQCTGHSHNSNFRFTERRRRNIGIRFQRAIRRVHNQNNLIEVILVWLPGPLNPADLMSKAHADVDIAINSSFW